VNTKQADATARGPVEEQLRRENALLRQRLEQAEETLRALSAGEVDAVMVEPDRVLTLELPDNSYRLLVEQMAYPAATLTPDGKIIYANRRFADLVSRPLRSLPGTAFLSLVIPASRPALDTLLRDGCAGEAHADITVQREDGTTSNIYLGARTLKEGAFGECLVVMDLTTQRHYEDLRRATEALKLADRRKDEFVATLAHELRNPLAPIRNAVQVLKTPGLGESEQQWGRDVIDRQVNVLARLLEDLLDVSRISLHRLTLRREPTALAAVVEAALETSRPVIDASGHTLTVDVPKGVMLSADPVRLAQVLSNLLTNAAKYTEQGGHIRLAAKVDGDKLTISVSDSGIGISPEMLPHIFEMFSQAKPALARAQGGLGIGLALVRGLVELHGGTIDAKSAGVSEGSEFLVRLPGVLSASA
jgi:signal transduction histidine kinase